VAGRSTRSLAVTQVPYQTVFDISSSGYKSWSFPAYGLVFVAVGAILMLSRHSIPKKRANSGTWVFAFALVWSMLTFGLTYYEYRSLTSALESGRTESVAGVVSNFTPMPASGHTNERFCVQLACFEYSDYSVTSGFNNTSSHGGPIRMGLPVRVTYVDGHIVKLEVGQGDR